MADHSVTKIIGIGPVTAKALEVHGITTVKQLSELEPGEISVNNLSTLIDRAKTYLKAYNNDTQDESKVEVVVLGKKSNKLGELFSTKLKKTPVNPLVSSILESKKDDVKEEKEKSSQDTSEKVSEVTTEETEEENKYLIQDHSWWEMKVLIPKAVPKTNHDDEGLFVLKEAIVYELSIEPHNRISFVCSWVSGSKDKKEEKLCTMTYSPQLIFYFNLGLPPLEVSIRQDDFKLLPNHEVLRNLLWETNIMHKFSTSENVEL
jgi:predicted flap endonuclease-1-like 5' DNA nuclease